MKTNLSTISVTVMPTSRLSIKATGNCDTGGGCGGGCGGGGGGGCNGGGGGGCGGGGK
jgi:hypothetical protein